MPRQNTGLLVQNDRTDQIVGRVREGSTSQKATVVRDSLLQDAAERGSLLWLLFR